MKLSRTMAAMVALIVAPHANAQTADANRVQMLDARIAAAENAKTGAQKTADTICYNSDYATSQRDQKLPTNASEQSKQCMDAMRANSDAIGLVAHLYEQRSHLTGQPMPPQYACSGNPSLGAPHPDAEGHYTVCPKNPDDHSYKFWIITQVRMQEGDAEQTWSNGGLISMRRYGNESECRMGIAKYEDYLSTLPYSVKDGVMVGDVCVEVFIPDVRDLRQGAR